jgi:hypothetical protein
VISTIVSIVLSLRRSCFYYALVIPSVYTGAEAVKFIVGQAE